MNIVFLPFSNISCSCFSASIKHRGNTWSHNYLKQNDLKSWLYGDGQWYLCKRLCSSFRPCPNSHAGVTIWEKNIRWHVRKFNMFTYKALQIVIQVIHFLTTMWRSSSPVKILELIWYYIKHMFVYILVQLKNDFSCVINYQNVL